MFQVVRNALFPAVMNPANTILPVVGGFYNITTGIISATNDTQDQSGFLPAVFVPFGRFGRGVEDPIRQIARPTPTPEKRMPGRWGTHENRVSMVNNEPYELFTEIPSGDRWIKDIYTGNEWTNNWRRYNEVKRIFKETGQLVKFTRAAETLANIAKTAAIGTGPIGMALNIASDLISAIGTGISMLSHRNR